MNHYSFTVERANNTSLKFSAYLPTAFFKTLQHLFLYNKTLACSWSGQSTSGMAVMELGLPSGFSADNSGLLNDIVKRVDQQDNKLVLYLDQVSLKVMFLSHIPCVPERFDQPRIELLASLCYR